MLSSRSQKNRTSIPRTRAAHIWSLGKQGREEDPGILGHRGMNVEESGRQRPSVLSCLIGVFIFVQWESPAVAASIWALRVVLR